MRRLIAMVAGLTIIATATIAQAATPEEVLNEPRVDEEVPSASAGYFVWTANTEARPNHYNSFVKADGGSAVRVNPGGTHSHGAAIDGTTVVYDEDTGDDADLKFFDAASESRTEPPGGVNTASWEYRPSLSGDQLLFTRSNGNRVDVRDAWVKVVLFDLSTETSTVLSKLPIRTNYLVSDQVNGDWATFESCRVRRGDFSDCQVHLYDISADTLTEVTNPGMQQYAGGVSADGTVYLVRQRNRDHWVCGKATKVVRMDGGNGTVIATLPEGKEIFNMFAFDQGGSTTLYMDPTRCRNGVGGISRITDADTTTL
ncbi:MAG: hypothetical protein ACXWW9_00810 [Actinomycetota bacterium]